MQHSRKFGDKLKIRAAEVATCCGTRLGRSRVSPLLRRLQSNETVQTGRRSMGERVVGFRTGLLTMTATAAAIFGICASGLVQVFYIRNRHDDPLRHPVAVRQFINRGYELGDRHGYELVDGRVLIVETEEAFGERQSPATLRFDIEPDPDDPARVVVYSVAEDRDPCFDGRAPLPRGRLATWPLLPINHHVYVRAQLCRGRFATAEDLRPLTATSEVKGAANEPAVSPPSPPDRRG